MGFKRETFRDKKGYIIGHLDFHDSGKIVARDAKQRELGYYNQSTNKTFRKGGRFFGNGDKTKDLVHE